MASNCNNNDIDIDDLIRRINERGNSEYLYNGCNCGFCCCGCPQDEYIEPCPQVPASESVTNTAFSAQNLCGQSFSLNPGGIAVPLPHISYNNDFELCCKGEIFTARVAGFYYISYQIKTTDSRNIVTAVHKNGEAIPNLIDQTPNEKNHSCQAVVFLNVGDDLQLVISGNSNIRLVTYTGANLDVIKIA